MEIKAVVRRKNRNREGRGFSRSELKEAGIDLERALKLRIPTDLRRRTKHTNNIEVLRRYMENLKTFNPPKETNQTTAETI